MTTTIDGTYREKAVPDDTDYFGGQDAEGSYKTHVSGLRGLGVNNIRTTAVSQDVTPQSKVVTITTSGSGLGTDVINLTNPALNENSINTEFLGARVFFVLNTQTDPSDVVQVTVAGVAWADYAYPGSNVALDGSDRNNTILLNFAGACVCLVWCADGWKIDAAATDLSFTGATRYSDISIKPGDVTGTPGKNVTLDAGGGDTVGLIKIGSLTALPTTDPGEPNGLWVDAANGFVLKISQG